MIDAYPVRASLRQGEVLALRVRADEPSRLRFARAGATFAKMREAEAVPVPPGETEVTFLIPEGWQSGAYVAVFERPNDTAIRLDARDARALFVVRNATPQSPLLYNVPLFTYHAYNVGQSAARERTCLYNAAPSVSLERCGGGVGGHLWDERNVDVYDPATPRQTFAHWDARAIAWLERNRIFADYCCDLDLHEDASLFGRYSLVLAFGHHEYWTDSMRAGLDDALNAGSNAAFFTGNTCFFRTHYDRTRRAISRVGQWKDDPEERTFGVSYRFGGGKWIDGRPPTGFRISQANHWIFCGSGSRDGDVFGEDERLVGYECDGRPPHEASHLTTLAEASIEAWPVSDGSGEINGGRATLGIVSRRGSLFIAGTTDWARALDASEPTVVSVTRNVIERLSANDL